MMVSADGHSSSDGDLQKRSPEGEGTMQSTAQASRKRKRVNDGSRRARHVCDIDDCGKSYTRAEHLYRHQLNHNPKQIFHCSWQGCGRHFVRQDLCTRHEDRHTAKGTKPVRPWSPVQPTPSQMADSLAAIEAPHGHARNLSSSAINRPSNGTSTSAAEAGSLSEGVKVSKSTPPVEDALYRLPHISHSAIRNTSTDSPIQAGSSIDPAPSWSSAYANVAPTIPASDGQMLPSISELECMPFDAGQIAQQHDLSKWDFAFQDETMAWLFGSGSNLNDTYQEPLLIDNSNNMDFLATVDSHPSAFLYDLSTPSDTASSLGPVVQCHASNLDHDPTTSEFSISEAKRVSLVRLIEERFDDGEEQLNIKGKQSFLEGDQCDDRHVLSRGMIVTYLHSYFVHFHPSVPLIHRPSFHPDRCPNLLLLAIVTLGATSLNRIHGYVVTQACAELATFLGWNLRWQLFRDEAFRPPAKLWMFQALLLLEFYEKCFTTARALHERADIHHGCPLNLLRRGSFLFDRAPDDSEEPDTQRASSSSSSLHQWWTAWAAKEAMRRAVFTAFLLDVTHAILFGHTAVLAVQELNLLLPVDDEIWESRSPHEVLRLWTKGRDARQHQPRFLDALKQTMNGLQVKTNSFGRAVLMVGLLSVGWHMSQRDQQVNSLVTASKKEGNDEKWRISMKRSFVNWMRDHGNSEGSSPFKSASRDVAYHLAYMSLDADVIDVQTFAGAKVLRGRPVSPSDVANVRRQFVNSWSKSQKGREATFHAIKLLTGALIDADQAAQFDYSAREDNVLMRAWILHYAALVLWSFGFASSDCRRQDDVGLLSRSCKVERMLQYLRRMQHQVQEPEDLRSVDVASGNIGLLLTLRDLFVDARWHLLHEASTLLDACIRQSSYGAE